MRYTDEEIKKHKVISHSHQLSRAVWGGGRKKKKRREGKKQEDKKAM